MNFIDAPAATSIAPPIKIVGLSGFSHVSKVFFHPKTLNKHGVIVLKSIIVIIYNRRKPLKKRGNLKTQPN